MTMSSLLATFAPALALTAAGMTQPGTAPDPLDELDPGLPQNVRVESWNYADGLDQPPLSQTITEIGPDWFRLEQYINEGAFGLQLRSVALYDERSIFRYDVATRAGMTFRRDPPYRVFSGGLDSPIEHWRALRGLVRDGATPKITRDGSSATVAVDASRFGPSATWTFVIATEPIVEIRSLQIESGSKFLRMNYSDYRDVAGGGRHPFRVDIDAVDRAAPPDSRPPPVVLIAAVEPLRSLEMPERWELPDGAVIVDQDSGHAFNGKGVRIDTRQTTPPLGGAIENASRGRRADGISGYWILLAGTVLIMVAGTIWLRRRVTAP